MPASQNVRLGIQHPRWDETDLRSGRLVGGG
jgi:hypothetical protein